MLLILPAKRLRESETDRCREILFTYNFSDWIARYLYMVLAVG